MGIKGQKSTILEKKSKITKNCQKSWNFSKIWLLSPRIWLVAQTCPPLPDIWPFMKKIFFSYKKWDFLAIFLKKSISDPPNLSKNATTRSSIKKCHKEKVIFSPIHGRMQKIRKSYWIVFENMPGAQGPVIYGTTTRTGQGPYPALPDKLCKNSDHLESLVAPLRATCFWLLVPIISLLRICCAFRAHADKSILAVPFGHCQHNSPLSRLEANFFKTLNTSIL